MVPSTDLNYSNLEQHSEQRLDSHHPAFLSHFEYPILRIAYRAVRDTRHPSRWPVR